MRLTLITIIAFAFLALISKASANNPYIADAPDDAYRISVNDARSARLTDLQCLALNIYHEARGEPLIGQYAVAMVTLNRVSSRSYPGSVCGVVLQYRQFSWVDNGRSAQPDDEKAWKLSYNIAYRFLEGGYFVPWMATWTHYHRVDIEVDWLWVRPVEVVGAHLFYESSR